MSMKRQSCMLPFNNCGAVVCVLVRLLKVLGSHAVAAIRMGCVCVYCDMILLGSSVAAGYNRAVYL
eukprot:4704957-Pleurochrysis_carterae.AAC.3